MERFVLIPYSLYQQSIESNKQQLGLLDKQVSQPEPSKLDINQSRDDKNQIDRIHYQLTQSNLQSKTSKEALIKFQNSPRINYSESDTIILDGRDTFVPVVDFFLTIRNPKKKKFPDVYFPILEASNLEYHYVTNQHAKEIERGNWLPFNF